MSFHHHETSLAIATGQEVRIFLPVFLIILNIVQRYRKHYYGYLFPAYYTKPFPVAVPLDRGLSEYMSIDDLRTSIYVCAPSHRQSVQILDETRTIITHYPHDRSVLPYPYAIYCVVQTEPSNPPNISLWSLSPPPRGDVLIIRLDTHGGKLPVRRARPCHLDERDVADVTRIVLG